MLQFISIRLAGIFVLMACLHTSARSEAQQRINISLRNVSLDSAFKEIEKKTDYVFFYDVTILKGSKLVSVEARDASIEEVLNMLIRGQDVHYVIHDKTVFVKKGVKETSGENAGPVHDPKDTLKGNVKMSGVVYNESGQPLSGANVTVEKTGTGTITNAKGEFSLNNIPAKSKVVVSYIGYSRQTVEVRGGVTVQVYLKVAKNDLDKVVVQAYGQTTARLNTGNIGTVTAEQIERQPIVNPLAALQGQVPGLVITQDNGYATSPFKVEIRGRSVIDAGLASEPLYIIDGVPLTVVDYGNNGNYASGSVGFTQNGFVGPAGGQSPLYSINPADIESVSVLKDADATSIYGSRGANGVIIITTKKGKPGKTRLEGSVYQGESFVTRHYQLLNTQQYLQMRREALKNDGIAPDPGNDYDLFQWDTTRYTDWQKELWGGVGRTTDAELNVSGGDKQTTFRLGGGYHRQADITAVSGADQRASVQFNLTNKSLDQKFSTSFTSTYSYSTSNVISLPSVVLLPPDAPPIFDSHGNLNFSGWGAANSEPANDFFFSNLKQPYNASTSFLNSSIRIQYEFVKGLSLSANVGYSTYHLNQAYFIPIASLDPRLNPTGSAEFGNNDGSNFNFEPTLDYKRAIGRGKMDLLAGIAEQTSGSKGDIISASGFANDNLLGDAAAARYSFGQNGSGEYKYEAVYGRISYNLADRYLLNITARRDGSSKFGPGHQYGDFGSIGMAWIFSEEDWVKQHFPILSFGKIRGSYGTTGSDQIPNYRYLSQWSANGNVPYQQAGSPAFTSILLNNPNLEWQSNHKLEGAIDLNFFKDMVSIEIATYLNKCGNQLIPLILPAITGFTSVYANSPALVQNSGLEGMFKFKVVDTRKWLADAYFNIGFNRNKLDAYPGLALSPYASAYTIGKSLSIKRLLKYTGVDPLTGQYVYEDKNHDGSITNAYNNGNNDLYDKDLAVQYDGGFGINVGYKGFKLNAFLVFRKQTVIGGLYSGNLPGQLGVAGNQSVAVLNRWQHPGDHAQYARFSTQGALSDVFYATSDGVYRDGSYVRLRNLSLSYDLSPAMLRKLGGQSVRIYIRGENLFLITRYDGIDPDVPGLGILPLQKVLTAGLQFNL